MKFRPLERRGSAKNHWRRLKKSSVCRVYLCSISVNSKKFFSVKGIADHGFFRGNDFDALALNDIQVLDSGNEIDFVCDVRSVVNGMGHLSADISTDAANTVNTDAFYPEKLLSEQAVTQSAPHVKGQAGGDRHGAACCLYQKPICSFNSNSKNNPNHFAAKAPYICPP